MKKIIALVGLGVLAATGTASAAAPAFLPVQGFLANADGSPVDGDTVVAASVFTTDTGGTALWSETQTVSVDQGAFTMYLGDVATLDLSLFKDNEFLYLQITVGTDAPMSRFQLATTPYAGFAQFADDSATVGGMGPTDFAAAIHGHGWTELTGVPADLADGDADTTYSAGAGLTLTGTTFSVDTSGLQSRVTGTCAAGSSIRVIDAAGAVTCQTDADTTYSAGTGLTLTGTTFSVNTATLQTRVTGTCAAGSSIRVIDAAGAVTCETDDGVTYSAGAGLTLTGTTFAVSGVTSAMITDGTIVSADIADGAVADVDLASSVVGSGTATVNTTIHRWYWDASNSDSTHVARVILACNGESVGAAATYTVTFPGGTSTFACPAGGTRPWTFETPLFYLADSADVDVQYRVAAAGTRTYWRSVALKVDVLPQIVTTYWSSPDPTGAIGQGNWNGPVRFRTATSTAAGRLEVSTDNGATWGTVCDDSFSASNTAADVVCRSMGYSSGVVMDSPATPDGTGAILVDDVTCPIGARSIFECRVRQIGTNDCSHSEDVGVTCS